MKLIYLEYFVDVVKYGSISKAAEAHYLKQGNLSNYIKAIENDFNATLFIRNSKGVELTPEGQQVFLWAQRTLNEQQLLKDSFTNKVNPLNTLSGTITFFLSPSINPNLYPYLLIPFSQEFPEIQVQSRETNLSSIIDFVEKTPNSIGISIFDQKHLDYIASKNTLTVLTVHTNTKLIVYVAKNSKFSKAHKSIGLKALSNLPILLYSPSQECVSPIVEILSNYVKLNIVQETSNLSLFHSLLHTGQYIAVGINLSYGMEEYESIIIRDKITLSSCLLAKSDTMNTSIINTFIKFYYKQKHLPCPAYFP